MSKFTSWAATTKGRNTLVSLLALALVMLPFYQPRDVQTTLTFAIAYAIAAIGLTILVGVGGQLNLAHGFFVALGAYGYTVLAGDPTSTEFLGYGLPPVIAAVGGVLRAGVLGLVFSPVAARLKGLYLGMASISLIFIGDYVLTNATFLTGGLTGRPVHKLELFGLPLSGSTPKLMILGTNFDGIARLWLIAVLAIFVAYIIARRIVRGRPGQALQLVRDNPAAAAAIGVDVQHAKAEAFVVSSAYAGVAGVFMALASQTVVPQTFGMMFSMSFLAMIIIGGLGSVGGAIFGAALVAILPALMDKLGGSRVLPFVDPSGLTGISGGTFSNIVFGAAVVLILIFEPNGVAGLMRRLRKKKVSPVTQSTQSQPEGTRGSAREHTR